jgi:hypothetical protein
MTCAPHPGRNSRRSRSPRSTRWVAEESGGYRGQMAVYVRPNGLLGNAYMTAIKPFRHLVVYPQMLGAMERRWQER